MHLKSAICSLTSHVLSHVGEKGGGGQSGNCEEAQPSRILARSCLWSLMDVFVDISLVIAFLKKFSDSVMNTGFLPGPIHGFHILTVGFVKFLIQDKSNKIEDECPPEKNHAVS